MRLNGIHSRQSDDVPSAIELKSKTRYDLLVGGYGSISQLRAHLTPNEPFSSLPCRFYSLSGGL